ncbi:MAG: hypothetical protein HYT30_01115 [Parcubacteria group bacterium]|nr:hypothetical protein [Parcubacteria group bacterium]
MKKKPAKTGAVKKAAKRVAKKATASRTAKSTKISGAFFSWREDKNYAIGLTAREGAAYPSMRRGKKWEHAQMPAIRARGADHDPNRPKMFFDHHGVETLGVFDIPEGALVIYQSTHTAGKVLRVALGAALFAVHELTWKERWRTELPIFECDIPLPKTGSIAIRSCELEDDMIRIEWLSGKKTLYTYSFPQPFTHLYPDPARGATLTRYDGNPIIAPNPTHDWETVATLNPAAVLIDDKVHLFYRAIGNGGRSVWGHAVSKDGLHFRRNPEPAYIPGSRAEGKNVAKEKKYIVDLRCPTSGVDGAEDPRATILEDNVHFLYAAFNGWEQARTAHISTSVECVRQEEIYWNRPTLLTAPPTHWGTGGKNAALLPAKIDGQYVIFHRVWPDICIDYTDSLDMREFRDNDKRWLEAQDRIRVRPAHWDSGKVLVGAPPIETKYGWLLIYNAVSHQHNGGGYKIGAMILDKHDPAKVLYRSMHPILTARAWYEETGHTPRVTYACGAVIKDGTLFVYYGGADTYVNVATAPIDAFLEQLRRDPAEQSTLHVSTLGK